MVMALGPGPEFDLIRDFLAGARGDGPGVRVGPGDDCAVVTGDGIAVTVDMAVEDVHFRRDWVPPADLAYHATAAAISDLAAVAARPIGVLASLALGPGDEEGTGVELMRGVVAAATASDAILLGGDLTRSPGPIILDITALGEAAEPVLRTGARPGHELWVTGRLGAAAAAVARWLAGGEPEPAAREAWARPTPRTREALWLQGHGVPTAMVDLSDGIAGDAGHIAAASGVRVVVRAASLPLGAGVGGPDEGGDDVARIRMAAAGGEDYELCFTARPSSVEPLVAEFEERFGIPLTRVGSVEEGAGAVVLDEEGREMELRGYQHWDGAGEKGPA